MKKPLVVALLAIFCCALWGSAFPCVKIGYRLFAISGDDTASQILFAGLRFTLAGVLVILMGTIAEKKMLRVTKKTLPMVIKVSLLQTVIQYFFFYIGLAHTTGVKGSILVSTNTFLAILVSSLIFRMEKLNLEKIIGCALGFMGVVIINLTGNVDMSFNFTGDGFILLSALSYSFSTVLIKHYSKEADPIMISGYQFLIGGIFMAVCGFIFGGRLGEVSLPGLVMLLYLSFISAAAYSVWSMLLKFNPVSKVSIYGFTNPLIGVILSAVILKEGSAFSWKSLVALFLVCIGIFIVNRAPKKDR
ncbi:MAG: DMT family transporter [Clostridia bacterium]|nr:DMT family transporter [Clostridia bacterium]